MTQESNSDFRNVGSVASVEFPAITAPRQGPVKYRPEIDGLRAIAVVAVVLFHAEFVVKGANPLQGGFIGVDVFFVISGYLITSLILRELEDNEFSIARFYERRARRILPSLITVMVVSIPFAWVYMLPSELKEYAGSGLSALVFASNIWFWTEMSYWAAPSVQQPFLHTWSLSIEEQFYVLFPMLLILIWKHARGYFLYVCAIGFLLSISFAQFQSGKSADAAFYLLPTRGWELLAGALLAKIEFDNGRQSYPLLDVIMPALGLALVIGSFFLFDETTRHPSFITLVPVSGTMTLIWFTKRGEFFSEVLSSKPLVAVGLVSYSFYLWHFPVFAFARIKDGIPSTYSKWSLIIISLCLAVATYFIVEKPTRNRQTLPRSQFVWLIASSSLILMSFFFWGFMTKGFEKIYTLRFPFYAAYDQLTKDERQIDNKDCHFYAWQLNSWVEKRFEKCFQKYGPAIVVLGDSHSRDLYNAISLNTRRRFVFQLSGRPCSDPKAPRPSCGYAGFEDFLRANTKQVALVIYEEAGHKLFEDRTGERHGRDLFRRKLVPDYKLRVGFMELTKNYLNDLANYTRVIWFGPRLEPHIRLRELFQQGCNHTINLAEGLEENFRKLDRFLAGPSLGEKKYIYKSQLQALSFDSRTDLFSCDTVYWFDGDHFSFSGEHRFGERIVKFLELDQLNVSRSDESRGASGGKDGVDGVAGGLR